MFAAIGRYAQLCNPTRRLSTKAPEMPVQTRKRKGTEGTVASETVEEMPRPPPKKRQKKQPEKGKTSTAKKKAGDEEEDVEDVGRNDSKEFLKEASRSEKKKGSDAESVKGDIQDALDKLLKMLEDDDGQRRQDETPSNLADQLRESLPIGSKEVIASNDQPNTPFNAALATLGQMSETVSTYQSLSEGTPIQRPDWMQWEQDHKSLLHLEDCALKFAARQVNSMVIPGKKKDVKPEKAGQIEEVAWEMFDESRRRDSEMTWGRIAMGQFRAFVGLLGGVVGARH